MNSEQLTEMIRDIVRENFDVDDMIVESFRGGFTMSDTIIIVFGGMFLGTASYRKENNGNCLREIILTKIERKLMEESLKDLEQLFAISVLR